MSHDNRMNVDAGPLAATLAAAREALLGRRCASGVWRGRLSSSALATATAVTALAAADAAAHAARIDAGLRWLADDANDDGGWGDSHASASNLPTTLLVWAAFAACGKTADFPPTLARAEAFIAARCGGVDPQAVKKTVLALYGADQTFSVPILTMCAISGRLGQGPGAWEGIPALPFELAALPRGLFPRLGLPVVSYALPALIAVGQARFAAAPPGNPFARALRRLARGRTLNVLEQIQPDSGGFLEAVPLTSFVLMCLVAAGQRNHPVVGRGVAFLERLARPDGSWPIDADLATWCTTLSVGALGDSLDGPSRSAIREWLLARQFRRAHPYTGAAPGGWAWTDLPGGVPDADDTAGAILALRTLGDVDDRVRGAAFAGLQWLMDLQNRDGGWPTFCRGWGKLPFDRSCSDLTAHALRAIAAWRADLPPPVQKLARRTLARGMDFLRRTQAEDGSWRPLWFGNEREDKHENPVYGTSQVVLAMVELVRGGEDDAKPQAVAGAEYLLNVQNADGGFGGGRGIESTIEETALALEAIASAREFVQGDRINDSCNRAIRWLIDRTDGGRTFAPSPIGLYFARLWYYEDLYPLVFTVAALNRVEGNRA
ncbi:MAG: squalene--hopene cyclase [Planctomycetota bacterium]|nr:squalene--hopene cyclase [Planctomycetota bacterium]